MSATNTTTYYNLSQFIGTDKPAWLQDYNGDMLKIDTAINNAKLAADSAANAASAAQNDATTALGDFATLSATVGTLSNTLGTAVGNINTINSLIGNGTPTTTDHTIIGAINELHQDIIDTNDKLSGKVILTGEKVFSLAPDSDNPRTFDATITAMIADMRSYLSSKSNNYRYSIASIYLDNALIPKDQLLHLKSASIELNAITVSINPNNSTCANYTVRGAEGGTNTYANATFVSGTWSVNNLLNNNCTSTMTVTIMEYEIE